MVYFYSLMRPIIVILVVETAASFPPGLWSYLTFQVVGAPITTQVLCLYPPLHLQPRRVIPMTCVEPQAKRSINHLVFCPLTCLMCVAKPLYPHFIHIFTEKTFQLNPNQIYSETSQTQSSPNRTFQCDVNWRLLPLLSPTLFPNSALS